MRLRRSTKLLLPLLVICLILWGVSRYYVAALTVQVAERRSFHLISADCVFQILWAPWNSQSGITAERLSPSMRSLRPMIGEVSLTEGPGGTSFVLIQIRWWSMVASVALLWVVVWAWRLRRRNGHVTVVASRRAGSEIPAVAEK